jgi:peptidyl-tRNA hydrolase, PTH1 family
MGAKKLVVGLGNPGPRYRNTPHNLGFEVVNLLASECGSSWRIGERQVEIAEARHEGVDFLLAKPQTFMNLSGKAVVAVLGRFSFSMADLIVVCDDLALPLGKIRIRGRGSAGGHNGLKSIIESAGDSGFVRVRLGILPEFEVTDAAGYVLAPIPLELLPTVLEMIARGKEPVKMIGSQGLLPAMNRFN